MTRRDGGQRLDLKRLSEEEVGIMLAGLGPPDPPPAVVDVFYREAGPANGPIVVLLHGFPSSSHMYRNLIPALADRYRVIAPDYPGFGESAAPDRAQFQYTFAHLTEIVDALLTRLDARRYSLYVMDYFALVDSPSPLRGRNLPVMMEPAVISTVEVRTPGDSVTLARVGR